MTSKTPMTDEQLIEATASLMRQVKQSVAYMRVSKSSIDESTGYRLSEQYHKMQAACSEGLALLEQVKRVRISQKTAKVGGGRRKAT